eukprot:gene389-390_t
MGFAHAGLFCAQIGVQCKQSRSAVHHPKLSDHSPRAVDVQFDDGLNTMKLLTQRFEAMHFTFDIFITFKVLVFGTCMFYAIKWHHDQGKKAKDEASRLQTPDERASGASETGPVNYSEKALARVWKAHRFLWWMAATMLGIFPESLAYDRKLAAEYSVPSPCYGGFSSAPDYFYYRVLHIICSVLALGKSTPLDPSYVVKLETTNCSSYGLIQLKSAGAAGNASPGLSGTLSTGHRAETGPTKFLVMNLNLRFQVEKYAFLRLLQLTSAEATAPQLRRSECNL